MSTAAVSSSTASQMQTYFENRKTDLQQLSQALKSGDLAAAQQAYSAIQSLAQSSPFGNSSAFAKTGRQGDFTAIGQALQSGDLAGAQQALSNLQSTFRGHHQHRVHIDPPPPVSVTLPLVAATASSSDSNVNGTTAGARTGDRLNVLA